MLAVIAVILISIVSLIFAYFVTLKILKTSPGTGKMKELSEIIHESAMAFLNREYQTIIIFAVILAPLLFFAVGKSVSYKAGTAVSVSFVIGAFFSALSGNIGMRIATASNARTANAAKKSLDSGLRIAFSSGTVMGMCVTGLGLLGISIVYLIFRDPTIIYGFGLGASSIALFARVGGGIFTKAADVAADLVGKVEAGIREDDPRNPAVIADNVGDNVGDVAGMGADLFESYVDSIIVAMVLGMTVFAADKGIFLPMILASLGIISSMFGTFFVKSKNEPAKALNRGIIVSSVLMAVLSYLLVRFYLGDLNVFYAVISGLAAGLIIGFSTEYYTSTKFGPTRSIAEAARQGAGINLIQGLAVGMLSTVIPVLTVSICIMLSYYFKGFLGIALAAVGMLSTLGITLAADTYGPVADNAAGIAEMANLGEEVRKRTEALDEVGNTTAAIGKGFAIGSAALTALALFAAYARAVNLTTIDILKPTVTIGLFIGGVLPFVFSSLTMSAVSKTASKIVEEVRRQFKQIKGLMEGKAPADYKKCIEISTKESLRQMILPSVMAIVIPVLVGILLGPETVGGLLAGSIVTGFLLAVMMANSGGAWDNAKKYVESGKFGGKGSSAHKAAVIGDTVGDPFKDTSGPALNILIKLMSIVALVFAPLILKFGGLLI